MPVLLVRRRVWLFWLSMEIQMQSLNTSLLPMIGKSLHTTLGNQVHESKREPIEPVEGINIHLVTLGAIGKSEDEHQRKVTSEIAAFIPHVEKLLESGQLKPMEYDVVGDVGFKEVLKALDAYNNRKGSVKKIVVRVAEE
jgi:hypothetical protein